MPGYRGTTCPACGNTVRTDHPHQHVTGFRSVVLVSAAFVVLVVASTTFPPVAFAVAVAAAALVAGLVATFLEDVPR